MASIALEEKINKIRLQNEEIKRRYEEVEADKKNAAKLDALIEPIPVENWPERKEPPEFSAPALKHTNKPKYSVRKHNDPPTQYYTGNGEGKKTHTFADGQGPPPDPKYNFLADSEREEHAEEIPKDMDRNKGRNKTPRGTFKRRGSGRDWHAKEHWNQQGNPGESTHPDYEAWRAERNRIDEARISRQRTAEGNWRREWDNDKIHLANEITKRDNRVTLGDALPRQEHIENDKHIRLPRTPAPRISHHPNAREFYQGPPFSETVKSPTGLIEPEKRVVIATDKSIKVLLNAHGTPLSKTSVMSVKVSPPNIAGTGRVGPRQRPRIMYSSQSEGDTVIREVSTLMKQKSTDESTRSRHYDQPHKMTTPKSPHHQRKKDADAKSTYLGRKDNPRAEIVIKTTRKDSQKSPHSQRRVNPGSNYPPKSPRVHRRSADSVTKSSRAESENVSENTTSVPEKRNTVESKDDYIADTLQAAVETAHADGLNELELNVDENTSEQLDVENISQASDNCSPKNLVETDKIALEQSQLETPASPGHELVPESVKNNINADEKEKNDHQIESHAENSNNSVDDINLDLSDNQSINVSSNSELTSNDSGFIESTGNDSIHNISDSIGEVVVPTRETIENCSNPIPSTSQIEENHPIIESHEEESTVTDEKVDDESDIAPGNVEITVNSSQADANISIDTLENSYDLASNTGNAEIVELQSQEESKPVTIEKAAEISAGPEISQDLNSSKEESPIVSTTSQIVAQDNADQPAVTETANSSTHEADKTCNDLQM